METQTVIVYGRSGCGKTYNKEKLKALFGCEVVIDPWFHETDELVSGALHLSNDPAIGEVQAKVVEFSSLNIGDKYAGFTGE